MSFEAEQQNTDSTEAVPGENNHDYLLKQGKGPEKKRLPGQQNLVATSKVQKAGLIYS